MALVTVVRISPIYSSSNYILHVISPFKIAVIPDNICTYVSQEKVYLDPILATLPPCTIERRVTVDGVEYPIVRSQPFPHGLDLNDIHMEARFYLNNLGYGTL